MLVKSIDNQILTSFRTVSGENNVQSETNKILHNNFARAKSPTNRFYKSHLQSYIQKLPYLTHLEIVAEEAIE